MFGLGAGFYVYDIGMFVIYIIAAVVFGRAYLKGKDLKMLLGLFICLKMIFGDSRLLYSQYTYVNIILGIINVSIWIYLVVIISRLYLEYKEKNSNKKSKS